MNGCLHETHIFGVSSASLGFSSECLGKVSETTYLCINCWNKEHDNCNLPDCICECNIHPVKIYKKEN